MYVALRPTPAATTATMATDVDAPKTNESSELDSALKVAPAIINNGPSYKLAEKESLGFFTDISDAQWKLRKQLTHSTPHHAKSAGYELPMSTARAWYQNNWNEDFSCLFEVGVGGITDGHKFVCDPHRLNEQYGEDCLVYSFGSNGNFDFERAVLELAPQCEIHIFDPDNYEPHMENEGIRATYHAFGLTGSYETDPMEMSIADRLREQVMKKKYDFKSFPEILQELGHAGRRIDIFKIDCEGCEYRTYKDWAVDVDADIRQIVVEVHNFPDNTNDFFQEMHEQGYVIFHKEPNIEWSGGDCVEFSFLKLHPDFFIEEDGQQETTTSSS